MRNLVRRYVTVEQRKAESQGVTEDDVNEIKQDISAFRCELVEILKNSGMDTNVTAGQGGGKMPYHTHSAHYIKSLFDPLAGGGGKKNRQKERRLMKGFNIAPPGSTSSLAPVAEFSTSLDNYDNQHEILSSTLSTLFTPNFIHRRQNTTGGMAGAESPTTPTQSSVAASTASASAASAAPAATKYNKSTLKYNKRIAGHKKRWGEYGRLGKATAGN